jgi:hypothetical protein
MGGERHSLNLPVFHFGIPIGSGTRPLASTSCQRPGKASNCGRAVIPRLTLGNRLGSENAMSPEPRVSTGNNSALSTSLRIDRTCPPPSPKRSPCPGCERWYDLHDELHWELQCNPWEWPCVARQSPKRAGSTCMNEGIVATMALLREAARLRTESSSLEEGGPCQACRWPGHVRLIPRPISPAQDDGAARARCEEIKRVSSATH